MASLKKESKDEFFFGSDDFVNSGYVNRPWIENNIKTSESNWRKIIKMLNTKTRKSKKEINL